MKRFLQFINPIAYLGKKNYSYKFPFFFMIGLCILSELYAYQIVKDPNAVGMFAIFLFVAFIMYFGFRDGVRGGFTATAVTIAYYFYIIYTRHHSGSQLVASITTTIILAILYLFLGGTIGWLKQKIDTLIEHEADEKRRLQAIVDQLPVGVLITDNKGRIVQGNKQIEFILGRKMREGVVVGKDTLEKSMYKDKPITPKQWPLAQALATGKSVLDKEIIMERPDGKKVHLQISASLIHNMEGKMIAAASIINDITTQKELEARKDDFVNMASHELKTPITSMKLYIELLHNRLKTSGDEKALKTIQGIKNQTEKLQELVNDLLDVSRLQTGKLGFKKENFRLDSFIEETVEDLQRTSNSHVLSYTKKVPIRVNADKFRIYQVITNLVTNAVKYSPPGTDIDVQVKRENGKAVVSVKDSGMGIARDQQKKIFERLYQVTDMKENTFPGLGMGLYISKEIIRRHKGSIWVESEPGKGSTFYFSLPLEKN